MALIQTAFIWVAYAVALGVVALIAAIFTYIYQTPRDRSALVSTVTIITLTSLLATVLLLPVDIALVSSTTSKLGAKKDWATPETVHHLLLTLKIVYYALYSLDAVLCLLVVPFTYFLYEEYDDVETEEGNQTFSKRFLGALKYTLIFVALVVILFLVGFFVPVARNRAGGHFDLDYFKRLLAENQGERALTFALGLLISLGTLLYILYTAAGFALLPISFIKSAPSISAPQLSETTATALEQNRERQRQIEGRNAGREVGMPPKDQRELEALVREERTLVRRERLAAEAQGEGKSFIVKAWTKVCAIFRPLKLIGGILLLSLSVIIWVSMLITGIDKAKNSICKEHCGYILGSINVFQPVNWVFVQASRVFPVDYVLMALLVLFFFSSSVAGIASIGIRFLWVKLFEIRKGHTTPQAMLVVTVMLTLIMLAINYSIAMMVAPQYATYGAQKFCSNAPKHPGEQPDCTNLPDLVKFCSELSKDHASKDVCTPSVVSTFLNRVTFNFPFFGALTFWAQFVFMGVFLIVFLLSLFRTPKLNLSEMDEDAEADEEEGLLASTGRRFGATWQDIRGKAKKPTGGAAGRGIRGDDSHAEED
ncbi:putative lysosomal cobalamin transporter [Hyaloscypha bicolor E]|uniref:Probable lysosomal cobalamin transporter n=1 Tax=Hyaloscypha bicolor E TaxID=1095630 RepID=A0A2J6TEE3_9HELO|nr:putative lysosomal cobalamin transporter [Hyaloscypha bicolor E]PMD61380.1 putative lysosomal cobalamin transporter [Hyaloscypha bicolor E]